MQDPLHELASCLLAIEAELRGLGWWSADCPAEHRLRSTQPFCVDTLTLTEWLQWILLPRMKELLEQGAELPTHSAITEMAEVAYAEQMAITNSLRHHLKRFDRLICGS